MRAELLHAQLPAAAAGLCSLLEHRPALLSDMPLGPQLLLDAIGHATVEDEAPPLPAAAEEALLRLGSLAAVA